MTIDNNAYRLLT